MIVKTTKLKLKLNYIIEVLSYHLFVTILKNYSYKTFNIANVCQWKRQIQPFRSLNEF